MPFDTIDQDGVLLEREDAIVRAVVVYNPFDMSDRTIADLEWHYNKTLAEYLDGLPDDKDWQVYADRRAVPRSEWASVTLQPNDNIIIGLTPNKSGGQILGIVAMLALTIAAPELGVLLAPSLVAAFGIASATAVTIMTSVVLLAGGLLVTALMPHAKKPASVASQSTSSYGLNGAKPTATEDIPVPVVYGTFRMAGNKIAEYVENVGVADSQDVFTLYAVSEGPISNISQLLVNNQDPSAYQSCVWDWRSGTQTQTVIPWFSESISPYNVSARATTSVTNYTTHTAVDRLRVDLEFASGLYGLSSSGALQNASVTLVAQYRTYDPILLTYGAWLNFDQGVLWQVIDASSGTTLVAVQGIRITMQFVGDPADGATSSFNNQVNFIPNNPSSPVRGATFYGNINQVNGQTSGTINASGYITTAMGTDVVVVPNNITYSTSGTPTYTAGIVYRTYEITVPSEIYNFSKVVTRTDAGTITTGSGGAIVAVETLFETSTTFTNAYRGALRYSITTPPLAHGYYQLQFYRTTAESTLSTVSDRLDIIDVNEVDDDLVAYVNTAVYAVHTRLGTDITSDPTVTALVTGKLLNIYDRTGNILSNSWSNNPADVALDIMLNARNNYAFTTSLIDFQRFDDWRQFCVTNSLQFNGVFDTSTNVWDAITQVMRVGRAGLILQAMKWSVLIEGPADPVMMFTQDMIVKGTFSNQWTGRKGRANLIEVQYYDATDYNRQHSVFALDPTMVALGESLIRATIDLIGCTDVTQATNEAWFQLALNTTLIQSAQFDVFLQALGCVVGDVVLVQHDMPQWGYAARVVSASGSNVILDSPIPGAGESDWRMLILRSAVSFCTTPIYSYSGSQVVLGALTSLTAAAGVLNITGTQLTNMVLKTDRVMLNGVDYRVIDANLVGSQYVLTFDQPVVGSVGNTMTLYKIDLMCEASLSAFTGPTSGNTSVTVVNWLDTVTGATGGNTGYVQAGDRVMLGRVTQYKKPFRIIGIDYKTDHTRTIKAIEYNASVYTTTTQPTPNYSALPLTPFQVQNLTIAQNYTKLPGGALAYTVTCGWTLPLLDQRGYAGANVYVSTNYGIDYLVGNAVSPLSSFTVSANLGDTIRFRVVAYDTTGTSADYNSAPLATQVIAIPQELPTDVVSGSVSVTPGARQISLKWTQPTDPFVASTIVYENISSSFSGAYIVQNANTNTLLRTGLNVATTYYYWLVTVATTGQLGHTIGPFSGMTSALIADTITAGALTTAAFAQSIKPIYVITTTAPGGTMGDGSALSPINGDYAVNEVDGLLYQWSSSSSTWTAVPDSANVFKKLSVGSIAAGAVSASQIAAGSISAGMLSSTFALTGSAQIGTATIQSANIQNLTIGPGNINYNAISQIATASATSGTSISVAVTMNYYGTAVVTFDIQSNTGSAAYVAGTLYRQTSDGVSVAIANVGNITNASASAESISWTVYDNNPLTHDTNHNGANTPTTGAAPTTTATVIYHLTYSSSSLAQVNLGVMGTNR